MQRAQQLHADIVMHVAVDPAAFLLHGAVMAALPGDGAVQHLGHALRQPLVAAGEEAPALPRPVQADPGQALGQGDVQHLAALLQPGGPRRGRALFDLQRIEEPGQQRVQRRLPLGAAIGQRDVADQREERLPREGAFRAQPAGDHVAQGQVGHPDQRQRQPERRGAVQRQQQDQRGVQRQHQHHAAQVEEDAEGPVGQVEQAVAGDPHGQPAIDHQEEQEGMALRQAGRRAQQDRQGHGQAEAARPQQHRQAEPAQHRPGGGVAAVDRDLDQHRPQQHQHGQRHRGLPVQQRIGRVQQDRQHAASQHHRHGPERPGPRQPGRVDQEQVDHPDPEAQRARVVQPRGGGEQPLSEGQFARAVKRGGMGRDHQPRPGQGKELHRAVGDAQGQDPAAQDQARQPHPDLDPEDPGQVRAGTTLVRDQRHLRRGLLARRDHRQRHRGRRQPRMDLALAEQEAAQGVGPGQGVGLLDQVGGLQRQRGSGIGPRGAQVKQAGPRGDQAGGGAVGVQRDHGAAALRVGHEIETEPGLGQGQPQHQYGRAQAEGQGGQGDQDGRMDLLHEKPGASRALPRKSSYSATLEALFPPCLPLNRGETAFLTRSIERHILFRG